MPSLQLLHRAARTPAPFRQCSRCLSTSSQAAPASEEPSGPPPQMVIYSAIQPTGTPHLGNYLGALRPWVQLQAKAQEDGRKQDGRKHRLYFSIADWHAITVKHNPAQLTKRRKEMFVSLLAVGLDPKTSNIFEQSSIKAHSELMWMLSCSASMGSLGRMTQWKSKLALPADASFTNQTPTKEGLKLGLFSYPVLQAADILLYKTTHVPVGEDQAQHIEFTRDLAFAFNSSLPSRSKPLLKAPETILSPAKRVMSLRDPTKKMSKSALDPNSRILITDSRNEIHKKVRSAVTDSIEGVSYDRANRPGVTNLIDLMYHMNESMAASPEELAKDMKDLSMLALKVKVADTIDENIRDVRERHQELMGAQETELRDHLKKMTQNAAIAAGLHMKKIRQRMGLVSLLELYEAKGRTTNAKDS